MPKLAFLSMDELNGFISDDELAIKPLQKFGWSVETLSWRRPCDWSQFDMVVIRTTWDYQNNTEAFLRVLEEIDSSAALLQNEIELVKWNIPKTYLGDLEKRGNRVVPTLWENGDLAEEKLTLYFKEFETDELIIKPVVSANADHTFRLSREIPDLHGDQLRQTFSGRPFMVQPFMKNIIEEGEYSLFYFGGKYSHAILKTPKRNDFRVQEEHGGIIRSITPGDNLRTQGDSVMASIERIPLYARVDFVRDSENKYAIMEVELVEPALYFRMDPLAAERFARTVNNW